jgi:hypothetical protein
LIRSFDVEDDDEAGFKDKMPLFDDDVVTDLGVVFIFMLYILKQLSLHSFFAKQVVLWGGVLTL